jgi:hypothetical protein
MKALAIFSEIPWVMPVLTLRKTVCDFWRCYMTLIGFIIIELKSLNSAGGMFNLIHHCDERADTHMLPFLYL